MVGSSNNTLKKLCIGAFLVAFNLPVMAVEVKDMLLQALNSDEPVSAVVTGSAADDLSKKTNSKAPVMGKAYKIQQLPQKGCSRLRFEFRQADAVTQNGSLMPFFGGFDLNLCQGGDAPFPR